MIIRFILSMSNASLQHLRTRKGEQYVARRWMLISSSVDRCANALPRTVRATELLQTFAVVQYVPGLEFSLYDR